MQAKRNTQYAVYYRTGGTLNFQWKRAQNEQDVDAARASAEALRKAGYAAHFDRADSIDAIGLPETFE